MRNTGSISILAGIAAASILAIAPAKAQNALGSGNSLDRNLETGGRGINAPVRNYQEEFRLRQAIVTGNVGGGREFRGSVGYTAANDFRGSLGSNSTYSFVADALRGAGSSSIGSPYAGSPYRGVNALQQQMGLTVGGSSVLSRAGSGVSSGQLAGMGAGDVSRISVDPFRQTEHGVLSRAGSLRSTSGFVSGEASEAQRFDITKRSGEQVSAGASALRGVFEEPALRNRFEETAKESRAASERPTNRLEADPVSGRVSEPFEPSPMQSRIEPNASYERLIKTLAEDAVNDAKPGDEGPAGAKDGGGTEGTKTADPMQTKLDLLRDRLMPTTNEAWALDERKTEKEEAREKRSDRAAELDAGNIREFTRDVFGDRRPVVPTFIDPAADPTGYQRNLAEGEKALEDARWFDAEEAFTRSLRYLPGDPIAQLGRAHAQIGAGMFLSAAVNLRDTLRAHPELAAARYSADLLPQAERLATVSANLRANAADRNDPFGRDCALLLAYVGWQTSSPEDVRAGFDALTRIESYLELERDPLHDMLETVWAE